jgi:hypothetical protein
VSAPVDRVLAALADCGVRRCGTGWIARCPAHDDRHASLAIGEGADGRALLHCHGGCELVQVLNSLGLTMRDLFVGPPAPKIDGAIVYDYFDERDELLHQVVRHRPKEFRQRRPDGCGGWIWDIAGVRRVLYRLRELMAASPDRIVYVVEGEKDTDNLRALGEIATTNPQGAGNWRPEYAEVLRGRHVVILPDHDDVGRQHGADVARSLRGVAASVRVVQLPGLPAKGDVSDWLAIGGTVAELRALVAATPVYGTAAVQTGGLRATGPCARRSGSDGEGPGRASARATDATRRNA